MQAEAPAVSEAQKQAATGGKARWRRRVEEPSDRIDQRSSDMTCCGS